MEHGVPDDYLGTSNSSTLTSTNPDYQLVLRSLKDETVIVYQTMAKIRLLSLYNNRNEFNRI